MTHLLKITTDPQVETVQWDESVDGLAQLYAALSTDTTSVTMIERVPILRDSGVEMWADEDARAHGSPLNLYATAYAGIPLLGNVALTHRGLNTGLSDHQLREEEDYLIRAVASQFTWISDDSPANTAGI